jgi:DNA-binding transcriptional LysR family regulator
MSINFELLDLRAFLAVYEFGSFHKAAELLNLSQPALSRRVQALEQRLHVSLLERSTRHVAPTPAGRRLEPIARRLLDELDSSLLSISDHGEHQSGQISIASIFSTVIYFLPKVIRRFNQRYPLIRIRVHDLSPYEGLESVIHGQVEFGINMTGSTETELSFTPLVDDPYVLACRRDHPLAAKKVLKWRDLSGHALIRIGRQNSGNRAFLDAALTRANVQLEWLYEVNNLTTSLGLVETGLGASVVPRLAVPYRARSTVITRPIRSPEVVRTIGIVERRRGRLSAPAKIFRDMLIEEWSNRPKSTAG